MAKDFKVAHGAIAFWEQGKRTIPGPVLKLIEIYEEELGMTAQKTNQKNLKTLSSSWLSRTLKLSKTTAGIATRLASSSIHRALVTEARAQILQAASQRAVATRLVNTLGEMKGLMMKVGQIISYMDFALPEPARELLQTLQDSTVPMEPATINKIIKAELGAEPEIIFKEWEANSVAAASIGQVHWAKIQDGTPVAVKVQYPGITKTLDADLKNVGIFDHLGSALFRGQEKGTFISELRERLLEECDYRIEAKNQIEFRQRFHGNQKIVIPNIFERFSTDKVLTSEWIQGRRFKEFSITASQIEKNEAGLVIWVFAMESIFRHRIFNADPHPGNYLFLENGRVAFLDFGCVKHFSSEFITSWKLMARAFIEKKWKKYDQCVIESKIAANPDDFDFEYHRKMMSVLYVPWEEDKTYRFNQPYIEKTWRMMVLENPNKFRTNLPRDWIFLQRLQWGLNSVLAALDAEANWHRSFMKLIYT